MHLILKIVVKYIIACAFLCLSVSNTSFAQDNSFKEGMEAYNKKNYLNALILFGQTLEDKYLIRGKDLPKVYLYRAKSIINIYDQIIANKDTFMIGRFPDMLEVAYQDLDEVKRFDNGKLNLALEHAFEELGKVTILFCQTIAKELRLDIHHKYEVDSLLGMIKNELLLLKQHEFKNHQYLDLLGLIEYKAKNYELAELHFENAEAMFRDNLETSEDFDHLYSYYYNGMIKYHEKHEFKASLALVQNAKRKLLLFSPTFEDSTYVLDHSYLVDKLEDLENHLILLTD